MIDWSKLITAEQKAQAALDSAVAARLAAYRNESDPLYFEWQYDQTSGSEQIWRDKVAEIKNRIPLPEFS